MQCALWSYDQCYVSWHTCYLVQWSFALNEINSTRTLTSNTGSHDCMYDDVSCKNTYETTYAQDANRTCWYSPENTGDAHTRRGSVTFSSPSTWPYYVYFKRDDAPTRSYPPYTGSGTNSNFDDFYHKFQVNEPTECWYDPKHDIVYFAKPNADDKVNADRGWAGAAFGLLGFALCLGFSIYICIQMKSSMDADRRYNPPSKPSTARSTQELPVTSASSVAIPSQQQQGNDNNLILATAVAVPMSV